MVRTFPHDRTRTLIPNNLTISCRAILQFRLATTLQKCSIRGISLVSSRLLRKLFSITRFVSPFHLIMLYRLSNDRPIQTLPLRKRWGYLTFAHNVPPSRNLSSAVRDSERLLNFAEPPPAAFASYYYRTFCRSCVSPKGIPKRWLRLSHLIPITFIQCLCFNFNVHISYPFFMIYTQT